MVRQKKKIPFVLLTKIWFIQPAVQFSEELFGDFSFFALTVGMESFN